MNMTQQIQPIRERWTKCHKLGVKADYGTKKNGGYYMNCIACRRKYYALKDKTRKNEDTKQIRRPRRYIILNKMLHSIISSIGSPNLNCFKKLINGGGKKNNKI